MRKKQEEFNYLVKSNSLIEARYRLSLQEMHVIYWLMMQIEPNDHDFKLHKLEITEFSAMIGINPGNQYKELRVITKRLIQRAIEVYNNSTQEYIQFSWLSSARYQTKKGCVLLEFSPQLKPYLLQLKSHFTKIDIVDAFKLKSIYAVRVFEILLQYVNIGKRETTLNDLRIYCGIEVKEYKLYADLKRYVIEKAKIEINNKTEYLIDYKEIKESRKVVAIKWVIQKKDANEEEKLKKAALITKELRSERAIKEVLLEYGFSRTMIKTLCANNDEEVLKNALRAVDLQIQRNNVRNPKAMLQTAIKEKWHPEVFKKRKLAS